MDPPVPPVPPAPQLTLQEKQVVANCYTVQQAVEAFTADNNGVCPHNHDQDTNLGGNTVIDLLPAGTYLETRSGFNQSPGTVLPQILERPGISRRWTGTWFP